VTATVAVASVVPPVFFAVKVRVPAPAAAPLLNDDEIVVSAPSASVTEVGVRVQLPGTRLPLQVVTVRLIVSEAPLTLVSVNVVLLDALTLIVAVPPPL
jgi:hypothetical protein